MEQNDGNELQKDDESVFKIKNKLSSTKKPASRASENKATSGAEQNEESYDSELLTKRDLFEFKKMLNNTVKLHDRMQSDMKQLCEIPERE